MVDSAPSTLVLFGDLPPTTLSLMGAMADQQDPSQWISLYNSAWIYD